MQASMTDQTLLGKQASTNGNGAKPFIRYIRISNLGSREAGNNLSAEKQLASADQTAARHELPLNPDWIFADEDVSGQTFEREDWQKVVELIETGKAGGVIVWNQARASRAKSWETMAMIAAVEEAGGRIYAQDGQITVATFQGEVMAFFNGAMDNKFAVEQGKALKGFVTQAIDRGAHLQAPYGYQKAERVASRAMPIVPNPTEQPVVKLMCELRRDGLSWKAIANRLDALGHQPRPYTRHGQVIQGRWRHQAVRDIVTSETILGVAHNGEVRKTGAHAALVSPELWAQANATKKPKPVGPTGGYTLTGLARCTGCGRVMSHTGRYIKCLDQGASKCPAPVNVPAGKLTEWVVEQFKATYLGTRFGAEEADATVNAAADAVEMAAARYETASERELQAASGGSARAMEIAAANVRAAEQALAAAERDLADANAAASGVNLPASLDADMFDASTPEQQNHWLEAVYAFVVVRRDPVWRGPISGRATLVRRVDVAGDPILAAVNR